MRRLVLAIVALIALFTFLRDGSGTKGQGQNVVKAEIGSLSTP